MYIKKIIPIGISFIISITAYSQSVIKLGKFEVSSEDLSRPGYSGPQKISEDEVTFYLEEHPEWRLPTLDELILMYGKRKELGMRGSVYIAYSMNKGYTIPVKYSNYDWYKKPFGRTFYVNFFEGGEIQGMFGPNETYVRLVKSLK